MKDNQVNATVETVTADVAAYNAVLAIAQDARRTLTMIGAAVEIVKDRRQRRELEQCGKLLLLTITGLAAIIGDDDVRRTKFGKLIRDMANDFDLLEKATPTDLVQ